MTRHKVYGETRRMFSSFRQCYLNNITNNLSYIYEADREQVSSESNLNNISNGVGPDMMYVCDDDTFNSDTSAELEEI